MSTTPPQQNGRRPRSGATAGRTCFGLAAAWATGGLLACGAEATDIDIEADFGFAVVLDASGQIDSVRRLGERSRVSPPETGTLVLVPLREDDFWAAPGVDLASLELSAGPSGGACGRCLAPTSAPPQPLSPGERCPLPAWTEMSRVDAGTRRGEPLAEPLEARLRDELRLIVSGACQAADPPETVAGGEIEQCVVWPPEGVFSPTAITDGPDGELWLFPPGGLIRTSSSGAFIERRRLPEPSVVRAATPLAGGVLLVGAETGDGQAEHIWWVSLDAPARPLQRDWPFGTEIRGLWTTADGQALLFGREPETGLGEGADLVVHRCGLEGGVLSCVPEQTEGCFGGGGWLAGPVELPGGDLLVGASSGAFARRRGQTWSCTPVEPTPTPAGDHEVMDDVGALTATPDGVVACGRLRSGASVVVELDADGVPRLLWPAPRCDTLWWIPEQGQVVLFSEDGTLYAVDRAAHSVRVLEEVPAPYTRAPQSERRTPSNRRVVFSVDGSASLIEADGERTLVGAGGASTTTVRALAQTVDGRVAVISESNLVVLTPAPGAPCTSWSGEALPAPWTGQPIAAAPDRRSPDTVWVVTADDEGASRWRVDMTGQRLEGGRAPAFDTLRPGALRELYPGRLVFLDATGLRTWAPEEEASSVLLQGSSVLALPNRQPALQAPAQPEWHSLEGGNGVVWVGGTSLLGRVMPGRDGATRAEVFDWTQLANPDVETDEESLAGWGFEALGVTAPDTLWTVVRRQSGLSNKILMELGPRCGNRAAPLTLCSARLAVPPHVPDLIGGPTEQPLFSYPQSIWQLPPKQLTPRPESSTVGLAVGDDLVFGHTGGRVSVVRALR